MPLENLIKASLRNISKIDLNTQQTYQKQRKVENVIYKYHLKPKYRIWDHHVFAGDHNIPVRIFRPQKKGNYPLMIFFHGGGWVLGNIDTYDRVCDNLANKTNHMVVSVDYRLAPEYPFPMGLMDCYKVTKEIFKNSQLLDISPEDITLIGDSAGGNLAAVISIMARDTGDFTPLKQILLYPVTYNDHSDTSIFESVRTNGTDYFLTSKRIRDYMKLYITDKSDLTNPYLAPLLEKDLSNQPKTLILSAELDPLRDEGEAYGEKLRQFGNDVDIFRLPNSLHGVISKPFIFPSVKLAYEKINEFLAKDTE